ncbi:MAG: hypothetical protein JKY65_17640 [Planctomycetes bacterium]|nr:hypothetical protein [Planctomycetota bacterium]
MKHILVLVTLLTALPGCCSGRSPAGVGAHYDLEDCNVALEGYDPVAYFSEGAAREGSAGIEAEHEGLVFRFASEANRDAFLAEPTAYPLAYGGWCAYAVAGDGTFDADPESFLVREGRLFLFHDSIFFDAKKAWLEGGHKSLARSADVHWHEMTH